MPRPGPRTTAKYSDRFKATAVRLSELPGVEVQDVAASLYIHPFMLSRWRKQAREGEIVTKGVQVEKDVAAELKKGHRVHFGTTSEVFEFIEAHREAFPIRVMCGLYGVSASGFYA